MKTKEQTISIVVPVYNESRSLPEFHKKLVAELNRSAPNYELIYCDDGSTDQSNKIIRDLAANNDRIRLVRLTRNFGKEIVTTAGIHQAKGEAIITLDADGQHPVELIPKFLDQWRAGSQVVVGIRTHNQREGFVKRYGSKTFYKFIARAAKVQLVPGATDYRLIDNSVQADFCNMTERNRITRGLVDWLGYGQSYIYFTANPRIAGNATYSFSKLFKLAVDSLISMSTSPLYIAMYLGLIVLPISVIIGLTMVVNFLLGDPVGLHATASAYGVVFILFLVGVLLISQGIIGLYLSHIHTETQNRPLYVIDRKNSVRFEGESA